MFGKLLRKVVGSKNDRELNRIWPMVDRINSLEPEMRSLSDRDLQAKTTAFKEQIDHGRDLDDLLPEAFAAAREAAIRVLGMRPFDVQLIGGIVLHEGKIAEMKTGEGKTLMSTLPVYLNALTGRGVHVVTVNDYLAQRDAEWMGQIYSFMGLTSGCVTNPLNDVERQAAYGSDVTYGTNNEFGFDYLRDNMKFGLEEMVQRELNYAIVDEVDSILIDEARTPLIISGPGEKSTGLYGHINSMIPRLQKETHYAVDEKARSVNLTEEGVAQAEKLLQVDNLYDPRHIELLHHTQQALKAHVLFKKDVDYIVKDNQVIIVDEFTGRLMPGRRYSDGLHQALEAKEKVRIQSENQTLATITFQNYFRMYNKLAGMTGTADTEAVEFQQIYSLDVAIIPTHRPMIRLDHPDQVYRTVPEKETAVVEAIVQAHEAGQPVLVGTVSIEKSEMLAQRLKKHGVKHHVLNAKAHAQEAQIIAQAGRSGGVTIATNMAGRGVDIMLGGNPEALARTRLAKSGQTDPAEISEEDWERAFQEATAECQADKKAVLEAGGLFIIGTERHESRRIDNQLRGRSGRQGDPGASRFYLSLEDDLLRIFGSDRIKGLMGKLGMEEGMPIEHSLLSRGIENAQRRVEGHNFEIRKHLLEYDDVMNKQRQVIYEQRRMILDGEKIEEYVGQWLEETTETLVQNHINSKAAKEEWDLKGLSENLFGLFGLAMIFDEDNLEKITAEEIEDGVLKAIQAEYQEQKKRFGEEGWLELQRMVMLQAVDGQWKDHLLGMDHLKEGIGLRGYGQKDPLKEYQREGFEMFGDMIDRVRQETVSILLRLRLSRNEDYTDLMPEEEQPMFYNQSGESQAKTVKRKDKKVGRNDPCPCGSGKKYKKCCGRNAK